MDYKFEHHYKIIGWKNLMILHWILNPGLLFNELFLGQRIPKIYLEDKTMDKPRMERSFVPCPHCNTKHDARIWSVDKGTGLKNWFGLYCPTCSGIIPCHMNVFTFIILAITYPIWGWFKDHLRKKWMDAQPARYQNIEIKDNSHEYDKRRWIITGFTWGAIMFIIMGIFFPLITGESITIQLLIINIVVWAIGGLLFGFFMNLFLNKKGNEAPQ